MNEPVLRSTEYVDKNNNPIHHADIIVYNGGTYVVMHGNKYGDEWTAYPCGNNPSVEPIHFRSIATDKTIESAELLKKP